MFGALLLANSMAGAEGARDAWQWPFHEKSIWNMPIGSDAVFVPAGIKKANHIGADIEILHQVPPGSPERPMYDPFSWKQRAGGTKIGNPARRKTIPIDDAFIVPDANPPHTPNSCAALLLPDRRTVIQINPLCRPVAGGPVWGWLSKTEVDLYGDGIFGGGHGGSGLSVIGGSIRPGELTGEIPLRHVIKMNLWAERYYAYPDDGTRGFRWPAVVADSYAKAGYRGTNPQLEIGALLAIPPDVKVSKARLRTKPGRILFEAMQNYGVYLVDDTAWDSHDICIDAAANEEMMKKYRFSMSKPDEKFAEDVNNLIQLLAIVSNNSAETVGGGGTPRVPLAPPLKQP